MIIGQGEIFFSTFCSQQTVLKMIFHLFLGLLATSQLSEAIPRQKLSRRRTIDSDELVGFEQTVPSGTAGEVYLAYQPDLYVVDGCVPFPAVDEDGNTK